MKQANDQQASNQQMEPTRMVPSHSPHVAPLLGMVREAKTTVDAAAIRWRAASKEYEDADREHWEAKQRYHALVAAFAELSNLNCYETIRSYDFEATEQSVLAILDKGGAQ